MACLVPYDLGGHFMRHAGFFACQEEGVPKAVEGLLFSLLYPYPAFFAVLGEPFGEVVGVICGRGFLEVGEESLFSLSFHGLPVFQESQRDKVGMERDEPFSRIGLHRFIPPVIDIEAPDILHLGNVSHFKLADLFESCPGIQGYEGYPVAFRAFLFKSRKNFVPEKFVKVFRGEYVSLLPG